MTARKEVYSEKELEELQELEHKVASARILGVIEDRKLNYSFEKLMEDHWNLRKPKLTKNIYLREGKKAITVIANGKIISKVRKVKKDGL